MWYSPFLEQLLNVRHDFSFGTFCRYLDLTTDIMYRLQYAPKHTQRPITQPGDPDLLQHSPHDSKNTLRTAPRPTSCDKMR